MKGKKEFTKSEAKQIKSLLNEFNKLKQKTKSWEPEQKRIRHELRNLGFYLSNFKSGKEDFTTEDFESLAKNGEITIL